MASRSILILAALAAAVSAHAQLKAPSSGAGQGLGAPTRPASAPAAPARAASAPAAAASAPAAQAPAESEKETAGRLAAAGWLTLLDRRDWGTAWETSAAPFRKAVPLDKWIEAVPKVRADLGALKDRAPATVSYKTELAGQPKGDYVSVIFVSQFEQREVEEVVTTVREADGRWRVTGYSTR